MPVTKTAKRALRSSERKGQVNKLIKTGLEVAIRKAKKTKTSENVIYAISKVDSAKKKNLLHKNRAARIKSQLSKLAKISVKKSPKKTSKATKK